jgi:hypothetical protein
MKKTFAILLLITLLIYPTHPTNAGQQEYRGRIFLQVQNHGEAWYVEPASGKRIFLGRPDDAYAVMRSQGIGISDRDLAKIAVAPTNLSNSIDTDSDGLSDSVENAFGTTTGDADTDHDGYNDRTEVLSGHDPLSKKRLPISASFTRQHAGKIFLQTQKKGEAWYVDPLGLKRHFLGRPEDAFGVMRSLGTGITNSNLEKIPLFIVSATQPNLMPKSPAAAPVKQVNLFVKDASGAAWYMNPKDGKAYLLGKSGTEYYQAIAAFIEGDDKELKYPPIVDMNLAEDIADSDGDGVNDRLEGILWIDYQKENSNEKNIPDKEYVMSLANSDENQGWEKDVAKMRGRFFLNILGLLFVSNDATYYVSGPKGMENIINALAGSISEQDLAKKTATLQKKVCGISKYLTFGISININSSGESSSDAGEEVVEGQEAQDCFEEAFLACNPASHITIADLAPLMVIAERKEIIGRGVNGCAVRSETFVYSVFGTTDEQKIGASKVCPYLDTTTKKFYEEPVCTAVEN